jgi:hypothetical protein
MPIDKPSAISEARPIATIVVAPAADPTPDNAILNEVMTPSRPP